MGVQRESTSTLAGVPVVGTFSTVAKGPFAFSLVNGHPPRGNSEIVLGATTMSQAKLHPRLESSRVKLVNKKGKNHPSRFPSRRHGGPASDRQHRRTRRGSDRPASLGVAPRVHGYPEVKPSARRKGSSTTVSGWGMAVGIAPGPAGRALMRQLQKRFSQNVIVLSVPVNLVNFGQAVDFPLLLGVTRWRLFFGAATLAHLCFS